MGTDGGGPAHSRAGLVFVISGPSGAGKSTLCQYLRTQCPQLNYSVSYTTRSPRPGEKAGCDYHFIDDATFRRRIDQGYWAEWAKVHEHYYGTSSQFIEEHQAAGRHVLLEIDVQGATQVQSRYPRSITIFIAPPSLASLGERLAQRGTDSKQTIARRVAAAQQEMDQRAGYRHVIVNDDLSRAKAALTALVRSYLKENP